MIRRLTSEKELNQLTTSGKSVDLDSTRDNSADKINVGASDVKTTDVQVTEKDYQELLENNDSNLSELTPHAQVRFGTIIDPTSGKKVIVALNDMQLVDTDGRELIDKLQNEIDNVKRDYTPIDLNWDIISDKPEIIEDLLNAKIDKVSIGELTLNGQRIQIIGATEDLDNILTNPYGLVTVGYLKAYINKYVEDRDTAKPVTAIRIGTEKTQEPDEHGVIALDLEKSGYVKGENNKINPSQVKDAPWLKYSDKPAHYSDIDNNPIDMTNKERAGEIAKVEISNKIKWPRPKEWSGKNPQYDEENKKPSGDFYDNESYVLYDQEGDVHQLGSGHVDSVNGVYPDINTKNVTLFAENIGIENRDDVPEFKAKDASVAEHLKNLYKTLTVVTEGVSVILLQDHINANHKIIQDLLENKLDRAAADSLIEAIKIAADANTAQIKISSISKADDDDIENVKTVKTEYEYHDEDGTPHTHVHENRYKIKSDEIQIPVLSLTEGDEHAGILSVDQYKVLAHDKDVLHNTGPNKLDGSLEINDGNLILNESAFRILKNITGNEDGLRSLAFENGVLKLIGDFNIEGNIYHQGASFDVETENLKVGESYILLRNEPDGKKVPALSANEKAGIIINKYDGTNDLGIVIGADKELSIGKIVFEEVDVDGIKTKILSTDKTDVQPVLTRRHRDDMKDGKFIRWYKDDKTAETADILPSDIAIDDEYIPNRNNDVVDKKYLDRNYTKSVDRPNIVNNITFDLSTLKFTVDIIDAANNHSIFEYRIPNASEMTDGLLSKEDKKTINDLPTTIEDSTFVKYAVTTDYNNKEIPLIDGEKILRVPRDNYVIVENIDVLGYGYDGLLAFERESGVLYTYKDNKPTRVQCEDLPWFGHQSKLPTKRDEHTIYYSYSNSYPATFTHGGFAYTTDEISVNGGGAKAVEDIEYAGGA